MVTISAKGDVIEEIEINPSQQRLVRLIMNGKISDCAHHLIQKYPDDVSNVFKAEAVRKLAKETKTICSDAKRSPFAVSKNLKKTTSTTV